MMVPLRVHVSHMHAVSPRNNTKGVHAQTRQRILMNILIFGPNGSGKGTQGALLMEKYGIQHIESGAVFRQHIGNGTELGKQAKAYIDKGELVPDEITIPMVLDILKGQGDKGWLLDGFPRNMEQARKLDEALKSENMTLDYVAATNAYWQLISNRLARIRRLKQLDDKRPIQETSDTDAASEE